MRAIVAWTGSQRVRDSFCENEARAFHEEEILTGIAEPPSLASVVGMLRAAGSVFAEEEAALLVSEADSSHALTAMIEKRTDGVPIEQILGWAEFHGLRVAVEPEIFIPRYRTEFLADQAISLCSAESLVVDLCCGSGAIGLSIISAVPTVRLIASDIDPIAVRCARKNLSAFDGIVLESDLFDTFPDEVRGKIDVLVANAPYVPSDEIEMMPRDSRLFEPRISLDGGEDGLEIHGRIAAEAASWLSSGGHLLIEVGERQAQQAEEIMLTNGLIPRVVTSDEFDVTVVIGTKS
jgi:release factor glutamine methyltransferase